MSTAPAVGHPLTRQPVGNYPKQAVVVIHGMGEQKPMDTIKNFARAVWRTGEPPAQPGLPDPYEVWSKPDTRTGSLELRRLTTRPSAPNPTFSKGVRQDFYELYWADLSGGSTWDQVKNWIGMLLLRSPSRVPQSVMLAWILLWLIVLVAGVLVIAAALPAPKPDSAWYMLLLWSHPPFAWLAGIPSWMLLAIVAFLGWLVNHLIVPSFGRVVRYTRAVPDNIAARKAIRERGLKLLDELHKEEYDRIIVVGHSLGSLLAYDLVSYFWATRRAAHTVKEGTPAFEHLRTLEKLTNDLEGPWDPEKIRTLLTQYEEARRALCQELRMRPAPVGEEPDARWLITDLITVGSPLGHADFLLANSPADMRSRIEQREYASCPPIKEVVDSDRLEEAKAAGLLTEGAKPRLFCFSLGRDDEWRLHHAAQFAVVRWTNIHDPAFLVLFGDLISAPAAPIFGPAVKDIDLKALRNEQSWRFSHKRYWAEGTPVPEPLKQLRLALDLERLGNP
jgi:hypothetical protein